MREDLREEGQEKERRLEVLKSIIADGIGEYCKKFQNPLHPPIETIENLFKDQTQIGIFLSQRNWMKDEIDKLGLPMSLIQETAKEVIEGIKGRLTEQEKEKVLTE